MSWSKTARWLVVSLLGLWMTVFVSSTANGFQGGVGPIHKKKTNDSQSLERASMLPPGG
jgi:hypothetical protein